MKCNYLIFFMLLPFLGKSQNEIKYSFFAAGHVSGYAGQDNIGVHPNFKVHFDSIKNDTLIKFGFFTGDIVATGADSLDWIEVDNDVDSLGIPVYYTVGNHDMEDRPLYENRYGITYYSFTYNGDLFIVLDPNLAGWGIEGAQKDFLINTLNNYNKPKGSCFILCHQLMWKHIGRNKYPNVLPNSFVGIEKNNNFWIEIEPLLRSYNLNFNLIAGDVGASSLSSDFMFDCYDNITYVASGMGDVNGENYLKVNIHSNDSISFNLICLNDGTECFGEINTYRSSTTPKILSDNLHIFPNPTNSVINIQNAWEYDYIKLINTSGVTIYSNTQEYINDRIDVNSFSPGIYFLTLTNSSSSFTKKIIIE